VLWEELVSVPVHGNGELWRWKNGDGWFEFWLVQVTGTGMGLAVRNLSWWSLVVGVSNMAVLLIGAFLIFQTHRLCNGSIPVPVLLVSLAAPVRVVVMFQTAFAQQAAATLILQDSNDLFTRHRRRVGNHISFSSFFQSSFFRSWFSIQLINRLCTRNGSAGVDLRPSLSSFNFS